MPTVTGSAIIGTLSTGGATLLTIPTNMKAKVKSMIIDNQSAAAKTVNLRDTVAPDPYDGVSSPTTQYLARGQWTTPKGLTANMDKNDLKGLEFIGTIDVYADATDTACVITINYELE
jgi:hypothetical protein